MAKAEYIAFGEEWEKEVMKFRKKDLMDQYKRVCQENQKLKKAICIYARENIDETCKSDAEAVQWFVEWADKNE